MQANRKTQKKHYCSSNVLIIVLYTKRFFKGNLISSHSYQVINLDPLASNVRNLKCVHQHDLNQSTLRQEIQKYANEQMAPMLQRDTAALKHVFPFDVKDLMRYNTSLNDQVIIRMVMFWMVAQCRNSTSNEFQIQGALWPSQKQIPSYLYHNHKQTNQFLLLRIQLLIFRFRP